ncbi:TPA: restriction endonuclease subunit S [Enterococcus faecium]
MSNDTQPEIRFPGFTEDWEERKLGDIFVYKQGQQVPVENQFTKRGKNRHRFIRIVDLTTNNEAPRYIEYSGDNIISSTDLFMIRYGQPGVIGYGYEGVIANNLFKLIPKIETYNLFFKYILDSMYPKIQSLSSSTTMPAISFKSLDVLAVRYPDKKEQEKIGSFFAQLDNTIALHQRKLDLLKETKKGFLQKMFPKNGAKVPEIRFPGFTEDWEQRKLGEVSPLRGGFAFKSNKFVKEGIPIVRISNILSNGSVGGEFVYYTAQEKDENYLLPDKSALLAMSGATTGKVSILNNPNNNKVYQNQRVGYFTKTKNVDYSFISTLVRSKIFLDQLNSVLVAGAQPNISSKDINVFELTIPKNIEEQKKIGNFFKQLDDTIALHQRKLDLLKETKKGFLQKMFV